MMHKRQKKISIYLYNQKDAQNTVFYLIMPNYITCKSNYLSYFDSKLNKF